MTGEITLRGLVLPVGGIKEKVLAAKRAGIKTVVLPKKNEKDIFEIEKNILGDLHVEYVERMDQVIDKVLEKEAIKDAYSFYKVKDDKKSHQSN